MHRGYIKIWRKLGDSGLLQMPNALALFLFLLMNAMHRDCKVGTKLGVVNLARGQYISGRIQLAADLKQSEREIRTSLSRLQELGIIDQQTTSKYSIYTIVNYNNYQDCAQQTTSTETSKRPANDHQTTTKEECKNVNNVNSITTASDDAGEISVVYSKAFLSFWDMYPNKKNKGAAFKAFKKIKPSEYPIVKDGLIAKQRSEDWLKDNGRFIPHPATWLNARGWEDETSGPDDNKPTDINEFYKKIGAIQ